MALSQKLSILCTTCHYTPQKIQTQTYKCTHICTLMQMEILFSSELCAEEQEWAERLEKEEEEETLRTSPSARRREPRDLETKMQKGQNQHV